MPQNGMNFEGRRRGTHCNTCKANGLVNCQVPCTGWVNGAAAYNGSPARISEKTPAGILNGTKPQCIANGYIKHGYKGRGTKAAPPRTLRKQGSTVSAATFPSTVGRVSSRDIARGISVNGATSLDTVALPRNFGQMSPESTLSAAAKNRRGRKKFRRKKRDTEVVRPEDSILPLISQREEEDWENEIQEVTHKDWEKLCFGVSPYGPEDVLHFSLRDLTLQQRDTVDLLATANYSPAANHPHSVQWFSYYTPTEPDQFADADE